MESMQWPRPFGGAHRPEGALCNRVVQDGSNATEREAENEAFDVESRALG
jgi:hypothetical protein